MRAVVCLLLIAAASIGAQDIGVDLDLRQWNALKWRSIGPNRGGRSIAAPGARPPQRSYFGATGGGLWKTTDGGTTWEPVTDGQIASSSVGAVAVSESNPDVVYLGMGETQLRGNVMQGDGVYRSVDAGRTWTHLGLADTQAIGRIRVHPDESRPGLRGGAGPSLRAQRRARRLSVERRRAALDTRALPERSGRGGRHRPGRERPRVLYASLWEVYRTPWMLSSGGPGSGLFKSTDGGDTWTEITRNPGLPTGLLGKITVTVSRADGRRVYALVEADDGGLFRSDDAGATWVKVNEERDLRQRAFYFSRIVADPKDKDTVYALNFRLNRVDRRWAHVRGAARNSRRSPRPLDRPHEPAAHDQQQRRRRHDQRERRRAPGRRRTTRRRRCITSRRRPISRSTSAARSRTTRRPACRATPACTCATRVTRRAVAVRRGRQRKRLRRSSPRGPEHLLRRRPGGVPHALRSPQRSGARHPALPAALLGRVRGQRSGALELDVPDRRVAGRSRRALRRVPAPVADDQRRPELGAHQPRPHARGPEDARRLGRADHQGPERARSSSRRSSPSRRRASRRARSLSAPTTAACTSRGTAGRRGRTSRRPTCPTSRR